MPPVNRAALKKALFKVYKSLKGDETIGVSAAMQRVKAADPAYAGVDLVPHKALVKELLIEINKEEEGSSSSSSSSDSDSSDEKPKGKQAQKAAADDDDDDEDDKTYEEDEEDEEEEEEEDEDGLDGEAVDGEGSEEGGKRKGKGESDGAPVTKRARGELEYLLSATKSAGELGERKGAIRAMKKLAGEDAKETIKPLNEQSDDEEAF
eukprot:TRINITY_DN4329_c2_g1_i1.p2 TRINITY_DN4329_c2_g1~~TRINITY_DN4329_c2_g1_i1.p2  ORF type:complete len:208 (+),score=107.72 TRINITY_DN4329_c2_g1_i1:123-746(+)